MLILLKPIPISSKIRETGNFAVVLIFSRAVYYTMYCYKYEATEVEHKIL